MTPNAEQRMYEELRDLARRYDIKIVTARQAPRLHFRPLTTRVTPTNRLLIFMRCILLPETIAEKMMTEPFKPNREACALRRVTTGDTLCFPTHQDVLDRKVLWE